MLCLFPRRFSEGILVIGAVGTVEKPERFVRRLFQAAEEIMKELPKASLSDFHGCGSFHSACRRVWGCWPEPEN